MKITIMGLGYVGSATAVGLAKLGHDILGVDIDRTRIANYQEGRTQIIEPDLPQFIQHYTRIGKIRFLHNTDVYENLGDVVVIATGTPPSANGSADLNQVLSAVRWLKERVTGRATIVMKSTVPPGTGKNIIDNELTHTNIRYVAIPEFLREGHAIHDWLHPDRIIIGANDPDSAALGRDIHSGTDAPFLETDITSAELIKYASNAFLATKISFINEIASLCDIVGASIDDVSNGVAMDHRIGKACMQAGVGYGGSCFPKDVRALDYLALTNGHNFELLRSAITVNNRQRLLPLQALREQFKRLKDLKIAVLGLSFKPKTDDMREAPSVDLIQALIHENANISTYDPVVHYPDQIQLPNMANVRMCDTIEDAVKGVEAAVIMTEWDNIVHADWTVLSQLMDTPKFLYDGRNCLDQEVLRFAGIRYQGVGRNNAVLNESVNQRNIAED